MTNHTLLLAQQQDTTRARVEQDIEKAIEEIDPEESEMDPEELVEFLQELANNPLNINRAGLDELLQVPGLNFRIVQNIIRYRTEEAPFQTVEDLTEVNGLGSATLNRILPYITVGTGFEKGRDLYLNPRYWTGNSRIEIFSRYRQILDEQEGYKRPFSEGGYAGNPGHYYQRLRYTSDHVSAVVTQEKDPGETLPEPSEFDYSGWHVALQNNGRLKDFIIGDFSVAFGQGLLLWNGSAFGKGSEVIRGAGKNERGVRPYTSAQESNAFRGIAATYGERLQFTGFYSSRKRTATEVDENISRFPNNTGFHRTQNELSRKNNLGQETFGGRIRAQIPIGYIGVSGYHNRFDKMIERGT
ncbi:MAG: helix-hairpin-helix domain-containing protein, partial [Balneolaceae bacterium]